MEVLTLKEKTGELRMSSREIFEIWNLLGRKSLNPNLDSVNT